MITIFNNQELSSRYTVAKENADRNTIKFEKELETLEVSMENMRNI